MPKGLETPPPGFEVVDVPGGEYAVGVHRGPYSELHASYHWLFSQWLPSSGREPANQPCHELYVTDPATTAAADLITHICLPLAPVPAHVTT
jgi:AraC family transcriptional regulator